MYEFFWSFLLILFIYPLLSKPVNSERADLKGLDLELSSDLEIRVIK